MTGVAALIWCPFPDPDTALAAIDALLDEQLIACGNLLPGVQSRFVWNGDKTTATECGTILKTNGVLLDRAIARLLELHPYEEPAILGWHCDRAAPGTMAWLGALGD